jgi:hypothetical protein
MDDNWKSDLEEWLAPFIDVLGHKTRARMCPVYVAGLIGAGDRKSVQPMAMRDREVGYDQLHHFISSAVWDAAPLEKALLAEANRMVGGDDAWLIVDDTALPKKGAHSVGVAPQYASSLGKTANCQSLVSLTLASREVPLMVGLRLFLPESWTSDPERMAQARIPENRRAALSKPEIAIQEIDRVILDVELLLRLTAGLGGGHCVPPPSNLLHGVFGVLHRCASFTGGVGSVQGLAMLHRAVRVIDSFLGAVPFVHSLRGRAESAARRALSGVGGCASRSASGVRGRTGRSASRVLGRAGRSPSSLADRVHSRNLREGRRTEDYRRHHASGIENLLHIVSPESAALSLIGTSEPSITRLMLEAPTENRAIT